MSTRVFRNSTVPVSNKDFASMQRRLKRLGFASMRDIGGERSLRLQLPPEFPGPGREVMTKSSGKSTARFVFKKNNGAWRVEQMLSRSMDERSRILVEAFPAKKHRVENRAYEATMVPLMDERRAVSQIDDLNVFLAGLDSDRELSETIDAQKIKKQLEKMGGRLEGVNSMVVDFLNYVAGFIRHCDELWAWQVQRLRLDAHASAVMEKIADRL